MRYTDIPYVYIYRTFFKQITSINNDYERQILIDIDHLLAHFARNKLPLDFLCLHEYLNASLSLAESRNYRVALAILVVSQ